MELIAFPDDKETVREANQKLVKKIEQLEKANYKLKNWLIFFVLAFQVVLGWLIFGFGSNPY